MSVPLNINGVNYFYPEIGDTDWGQNATLWAQAVTSGMLQKAGGQFVLTADANFGGSYGLVSTYFKSRSSNIAQSGALRLARTDGVVWRNTANNADLILTVSNLDKLEFNGIAIQTITVLDSSTIDLSINLGEISASVIDGSLTNTHINSSAAIAYSKLNLSGSLLNSDVNASAAIAYSKLAALNPSIVPVTNGSGFLTSSAVTSTELGYVSGVTSALQTQIDSKVAKAGDTMTGYLQLVGDPVSGLQAATKQYVDALTSGLQVKAPVDVATLSNITLSGEQTIDGYLTSGSRVLVKNQNSPAENGIYVSAAGAWTRATDNDTWAEMLQAYTFVQFGNTQAFSGWLSNATAGGTIGVTSVVFNLFSQAGQVTTDNQGIQIVGTQLSLVLDGSTLSKSGSGLKVADLGIADAQISASADIALTKLQALSTNRAVVSDGFGHLRSSSTVTSTEVGYLAGVTSAIQTQINSKLPTTITTTGDLIYSSSGTTAGRLAVGTTGQVLTVSGGLPSWQTPATNPTVVSTSSNVTLTAADSNKIYLIDTGAARTVQLPTPASGLNFIIKDSTGQAATNNISILRAASESIEGLAATKLMQTNWGCFHIVCDGTNWFIIN